MGDIVFEPIIPIPVMAVICVILIVFKRRGVMPYIRQILIVALLFIINLRPMYPSDNILVQKQKMDLNVIIVIDDTLSMLGNDQEGYDTRLDRAKADVNYILENLPGAKFSIISFNNHSHILTPFTDSLDYIRNAVDSIYPLSPSFASGTNITVCVDSIEEVIEQSLNHNEETKIVIFFLSDGENTDTSRRNVDFTDIGENISGGAVMGYGTERGAHMLYYNELRDTTYMVMDNSVGGNMEAITRLDEDNMRDVASQMGVPYINMNSGNPLEEVITQLREGNLTDPEDEVKQGYVDAYYIFMIPLALLTAYEFISLRRRG